MTLTTPNAPRCHPDYGNEWIGGEPESEPEPAEE